MDKLVQSTSHNASDDAGARTALPEYTERLATLESSGFKRLLPTQAPYRWNLRRLGLGRVLDVGCGLGRNLLSCSPESVGVDHNEHSVAAARARGLNAYVPDDFFASEDGRPASFDSMLCAHVLEHLEQSVAEELLVTYLPSIKPGGKVVLITPQEAGFASDTTHVRYIDLDGLRAHVENAGLEVVRGYSFPLPRPAGRRFKYNEFVMVASLRA
ncbi:class I SAM-dependent methyltransferase [Streptacidiphilus carbonis]|jgi:SAM-dependent methyltransferase|uniref:class I SAM-dependent methyltransferase n=1 Tax=Streptacidiphilus carbonis TaxID=105422 RepID=UPI0005A66616|nr:class I SAM-dependent methyltransferase [Streptacidiphilus carbonis]